MEEGMAMVASHERGMFISTGEGDVWGARKGGLTSVRRPCVDAARHGLSVKEFEKERDQNSD